MPKESERVAAERFDEAYYRRFYEDSRTQVASVADIRPLVAFVVAYLTYLGVRLRRVIDFGAGTGLWREALREALRDRPWRYAGVDVSPTACRRHGWAQGTVESHVPKGRYDLVICSGVLQYVPDETVSAAIANLASCCRGAVYIHVPTKHDRDHVLDLRVSDQDVFFRSGTFYRRRIAQHLLACGGGLFVPRDTQLPLWELEYDDHVGSRA